MERRARRVKRRSRKLTAAQRRTAAPRIPDGAVLAYRIALRGIARAWSNKARAALAGRLGDFALERRADAVEDEAGEAMDSLSFDTGTIFRASAGPSAKALRHSEAEFKRLRIKVHDEPPLGGLTARWRKDSAARVEKILARERDTITALLADSENRTPEDLNDRIEERFTIAQSKLETAAHDDILTLNGQYTRERQTSAGITKYTWTTAGEERVRPAHAELDGQEFDWDDPPVTNDDGDTNIPGEDFNCRCVACPVLDELAEDDSA